MPILTCNLKRRTRRRATLQVSSSQKFAYRSLADLPVEVLDYIVSFIDNPKDLLSLALSSKWPSAIILPVHIQSRHLRCDVRRTSLWEAVARSPLIASWCVSLEIIPEPTMGMGCALASDVIVPTFLFNPHAMDLRPDVDMRCRPLHLAAQMKAVHFAVTYIRVFLAAIHRMPALTRFHWTYNFPPTSSVFCALHYSCPALSDLHIEIDAGLIWEYDIFPSPFWEFHNLTQVSFVIRDGTFEHATSLYIDHLLDMLIDCCTRLENLHLGGIYVASTIFTRGRWPHLKTLYLDGLTPLVPENIVREFFDAHSDLERLNIGIWGSPLSCYPRRLRELTLRGGWHSGLIVPEMTTSYLEFLSLTDIDPIHRPQWLSRVPALRMLVIRDVPLASAMKYIVQTIPYIERLHMIWPSGHLQQADIRDEDSGGRFAIGCRFLAHFTHLTHLSHFAHMLNIPNDLVDVVLRRFAGVCPTLSFVELQVYGSCRWTTIERHAGDGSYAGWHYTNKLRGIRIEDWGGHFFSSP